MAQALMDSSNPIEMVANASIVGWARQNDKHPGIGKIEMLIPDEWAKNLQNEPDSYVLCRFPRKLFDQLVIVEDTVDTIVSDSTEQEPAQVVTQEEEIVRTQPED